MKKPTIEEIRAYCKAKGYGKYVNAAEFWNYYDSVGWKRGKTLMSRWRSAVTGWAIRNGWQEQKPIQKVSQADKDALRAKNTAALIDLLKDRGQEAHRLHGTIRMILAERASEARRQVRKMK